MNHATHSLFRPTRPVPCERALRHGERGFTLIELMIAVVVGSILVGFVFDIHTRMSTAFRAQSHIGSLQQGIRAANELLARDVRQAGFMMSDGMFVSNAFPDPGTTPGLIDNSSGNNVVRGFTLFNNPTARADDQMQPDRVHIFYADPDPTRQAVVVGDITPFSVGVNNSSLFQFDELLLFVTQDPTPHPHPLGGNMPMMTKYFACLVKVTATLGGSSPSGFDEIYFESFAAPFNTATNDHCFIPGKAAIVDPATLAPNAPKTQVFRLQARAYQIDVTNPLGPLEVSPTGGLLDDWVPLGIGFVDLQVTQRFVEEVSDLADPDGDGNPRMDWYSAGGPFPANSHLTQVGVSLAARTAREVAGVRSVTIPVLAADPTDFPRNHNPVGDAGGPKSRLHPEFQGDHVYRQSSMVVDMRNMGVAF